MTAEIQAALWILDRVQQTCDMTLKTILTWEPSAPKVAAEP